MKLIKTSLFSAIVTFIRISSGFVASKAIAIFTGPAGVALIGAFANFISVVLSFANGAITSGVVKYTAEFNNDEDELKKIFRTSFLISLFCSIIVGVILLIFAKNFSNLILTNDVYTNPIRILGLTIVLYSLNSLLISILNGKGQIRLYTWVNTIGSIIGLIFTIVLVYFYKVQGALYALVLSQSIVFFITLVLIVKSPWFSIDYFKGPLDKIVAMKLGHFSLMAIVTALTMPVAQIILRNMLISNLGINAAGIWQGMMRVSDGYLMLITTALSTYYLPKLSSLIKDTEIKNEIFRGYKIILPLVFLGCILIYFLRFFIIRILYTPEFNEMQSLFLWQLVGDFFKMASWMLAYLMLAKAMTKAYIIVEVVFSLGYVLLSYYLTTNFGLKGISIAFACNYFLCFIAMIIIFRKLLLTPNE
ncbi:O-antigen translocase [Pedobacter jeongneungensis]|uniref:O-antigen translocase n=1 Tax=Pedobacter jeongneungensis TaxID=947309 RepID=UPI0031ED0D5F